jgi:tetratricopeptide (TPR) repeat protein
MTVLEQADKINWNDYHSVVKFYESNRIYMDNFDNLSNQEEISLLIDYKLFYCMILLDRTEYDKMEPVFEHVSLLLTKLEPTHSKFDESSNQLMFLKGAVLTNKKKYKEAYPFFSELIKINPHSHSYKLWYDYTKLGLYNWVFNGVYAIAIVLMFSDIIFSLDEILNFNIGNVALVIAGIAWAGQYGLGAYYKKKKNAK